MDEPTSGLYLAYMKQVSNEILKLHDSGKTVLIVIHDLEFIISCCNYVVHFESGKVIENYKLNQDTYPMLKEFFS